MTTNHFKSFLKKVTKKAALKYIQGIQKSHDKVEDLIYDNVKIQPYLNDRGFTTKQKQFLFKLRTSMSDVKMNFKSMHQDIILCNLCDRTRIQNVQHILSCPKIFRNCPKLQNNSDINFEDVFKNVEVQLRATQVIMAAFEAKVKLETEL